MDGRSSPSSKSSSSSCGYGWSVISFVQVISSLPQHCHKWFQRENRRRRQESRNKRNESAPPPTPPVSHTMVSELNIGATVFAMLSCGGSSSSSCSAVVVRSPRHGQTPPRDLSSSSPPRQPRSSLRSLVHWKKLDCICNQESCICTFDPCIFIRLWVCP